MLVEIRIYRRHDADLMMLRSYGANISKLMRMALDNFADGRRIKIRLPDAHFHDMSGCTMLRYRLNIQNPKVVNLLKQIKKGYRNQFCKALLRDSLDCEPLGVYMETSLIEQENSRVLSEAELLENNITNIFSKRKSTKNVKQVVDSVPVKVPKTQNKPLTEEPSKKPSKFQIQNRFDDDLDFGGFGQTEDDVADAEEKQETRSSSLLAMFEDMRTNAE